MLRGNDQASDGYHSDRRILILSETAVWPASRGSVEIWRIELGAELRIARCSRIGILRGAALCG